VVLLKDKVSDTYKFFVVYRVTCPTLCIMTSREQQILGLMFTPHTGRASFQILGFCKFV